MRPSRTSAAIGITLLAAGSLEAASRPIARRWTELSLADIDVSPFHWREETCRVGSGWVALLGSETVKCLLSLSQRVDGGPELEFHVNWLESEPTESCRARIGAVCARRDRVVRTAFNIGFGSRREIEASNELFPPIHLQRILSDVERRIEPFAIPCTCAGEAVGKSAGERAPPEPAAGADDGAVLPPQAELPPAAGATVPYVLGQTGGDRGIHEDAFMAGAGGNNAPGSASSSSAATPHGAGGNPAPRAMRSGEGGLPAGVEVRSLRFYASGNVQVPRERRSYASTFDELVEYVNVELDLAYPERSERFPFAMEVAILQEGFEPVIFTQGGFSLEPGWRESSHNAGWGRDGGGVWSPGRYTIEVRVGGGVVARGEIEIAAVR
jgi:hypothetical protein